MKFSFYFIWNKIKWKQLFLLEEVHLSWMWFGDLSSFSLLNLTASAIYMQSKRRDSDSMADSLFTVCWHEFTNYDFKTFKWTRRRILQKLNVLKENGESERSQLNRHSLRPDKLAEFKSSSSSNKGTLANAIGLERVEFGYTPMNRRSRQTLSTKLAKTKINSNRLAFAQRNGSKLRRAEINHLNNLFLSFNRFENIIYKWNDKPKKVIFLFLFCRAKKEEFSSLFHEAITSLHIPN